MAAEQLSCAIGMGGLIVVIWQDAMLALLGLSKKREEKAVDSNKLLIFGSMRFPAPPEALELQKAIEARGALLGLEAGGGACGARGALHGRARRREHAARAARALRGADGLFGD